MPLFSCDAQLSFKPTIAARRSRRFARLFFRGRIAFAACRPSNAPSTASRCTMQNNPRPFTGAVHGIQNSGDTLDGTNAAQCFTAMARPALHSSPRPSGSHAPIYFPQSRPIVAAHPPRQIFSSTARSPPRCPPQRPCTRHRQSKSKCLACSSHRRANIPRSKRDSTDPPQPKIRNTPPFAPDAAPAVANLPLRLGRHSTQPFAARAPAAAPQPILRASSHALDSFHASSQNQPSPTLA
jgi:hypothetical protein